MTKENQQIQSFNIDHILVVGESDTSVIDQLQASKSSELKFVKYKDLDSVINGLSQQSRISCSTYIIDEQTLSHPSFKAFQSLVEERSLQPASMILQLQSNHPDLIQKALDQEIHYYLIQPYSEKLLQAVIQASVNEMSNHKEIASRIKQFNQAHPLLQQATFHLKSPEEAKAIASILASITPDPKRVGVGLFELLLNAIEHGNLDIGYHQKTELIKQGILQQTIAELLEQDKFKDKFVSVKFQRTDDCIEFIICDKGHGFEHANYLEFDESRAMDSHGRGIMIANRYSFDKIEYQDHGSTVICQINL